MMASPEQSPSTKICIKNLTLTHPVLAPDVWGKQKEQPAVLDITLTLRGSGFSSAATLDKLDDSTIHYGTLAKKVRAACTAGLDLPGLVSATEKAVLEMGTKAGGRFIVQEARIEVGLCKATMFGEDVRFVKTRRFGVDGSVEVSRTCFEVKEVKIMVLVGVNAYERQARQPLIVGFGLWFEEANLDNLFRLENSVVDIIQDTSFETLETLVEHMVSELRREVLDTSFPGSQLHLRIAKPRAIAFADAPVVDIIRDIPTTQQTGTIAPVLSIIKPYSG